MMNKKAGIGDMMYWAGRILLMIMLFVSMWYMTRVYESKNIETAEVEAAVFKHYLLYSPNGLSYHDPYVNKIYPGIVDIKNFDSSRLDSAANFGQPNNMVAASITLLNPNKTSIIQSFYNREGFKKWLPLTESTFGGFGRVEKFDTEMPILYISDEGQREGILKMEILVPKS